MDGYQTFLAMGLRYKTFWYKISGSKIFQFDKSQYAKCCLFFFFSFFSLADSSLINIICFLLLFVPLVYFVLRASYLNLFFNVISQLIYYLIMISG